MMILRLQLAQNTTTWLLQTNILNLIPKMPRFLFKKKVTALEQSVSENSANVTSGGGSGGGYRGNQR